MRQFIMVKWNLQVTLLASADYRQPLAEEGFTVTHLGIPLQTRKTDFGLDSPVSEVSATTLSSNNQKYQNILKLSGMKKNFWTTMELSHQVVLLKQFCLGLFSKKQNLHVYSLCVLKQVYLWFRQFSVCCLFICSCQAHFVNKVVLMHRNIACHSRPPL